MKKKDIFILFLYLILTLLITYPLLLHFTSQIAGRSTDARVFQWNNWWVKKALLEGLNLNHTDMIYAPIGASLASHNVNWVSSLLSVPLDLLFGAAAAYNITFLLTLWGSAAAMYALAYHLTQRRDAAFVAGLVFAFSTYHISGNWDGQMNLANIQWLPLFCLFLQRTVESKKLADALLAGLFFAFAALDCWFFLIFLGMWGVLFLLFEWRQCNQRLVRLIVLATVVSIVLMSPFLIPVLIESGEGVLDAALDYFATEKSTDLLAFFTPSSDHPLLNRLAAPAYARFMHWRPAFVGYSIFALAVYAVPAARRKSLLWAVSGLLFAALSLGATLTINGITYPKFPMPYRWLITVLPAFKIIRQPSRFNVMTALSLGVLVGLACAHIFRRLKQRVSARWPNAAVILVSALVLFEYWAAPCPLLPYHVSSFYHTLAQEEGDFSVLTLPLDDFYSRRAIYAQTFHHKKLLGGYLARVPPSLHSFIRSHPLLKKLQIRMEIDPTLHDIQAELRALAANNVRYVIIHKTAMPDGPAVEAQVQTGWRELFGPETIFEDREIVVYRIPSYDAIPIHTFGKLGVSDIRARRVRLAPTAETEWLAVNMLWTSTDKLEQTYIISLSLNNANGVTVSGTETTIISSHYPTHRWPAGVAVIERMMLPLESLLPDGEYDLNFIVTDEATGTTLGERTTTLSLNADAILLTPALADMSFPSQITFGDQMRLLGYTPQQDREELIVQLYWQSLQTMNKDYKIFVHLLDADGAIVAQHDTMPRNWSYPTSMWSRQEIFVDRIVINIAEVEPGAYRLAVGVYEPEAGRLTASDADGQPIQDNRPILRETVEIQ